MNNHGPPGPGRVPWNASSAVLNETALRSRQWWLFWQFLHWFLPPCTSQFWWSSVVIQCAVVTAAAPRHQANTACWDTPWKQLFFLTLLRNHAVSQQDKRAQKIRRSAEQHPWKQGSWSKPPFTCHSVGMRTTCLSLWCCCTDKDTLYVWLRTRYITHLGLNRAWLRQTRSSRHTCQVLSLVDTEL